MATAESVVVEIKSTMAKQHFTSPFLTELAHEDSQRSNQALVASTAFYY